MTSIKVKLADNIERRLKQAGKSAFPREMYCLLLGTQVGDKVYVDDLYIPPDVRDHASHDWVAPQAHWFIDAQDQAMDLHPDTQLVGWAHSHPYRRGRVVGVLRDRSQSEPDLACHPKGLPLSVIVVVQEIKNGFRSSVRFWGPTIAVEMV